MSTDCYQMTIEAADKLVEKWKSQALMEQERAGQPWRPSCRESEARSDAIFQCIDDLEALLKP